MDSPHDDIRSHDGPIKLTREPAKNPLFQAFFDAAEEAGYPQTFDVKSYQQEGFGPFDRHIYNGRRPSTSRTYLHPFNHRKNLTVKTRVFTVGIDFAGTLNGLKQYGEQEKSWLS